MRKLISSMAYVIACVIVLQFESALMLALLVGVAFVIVAFKYRPQDQLVEVMTDTKTYQVAGTTIGRKNGIVAAGAKYVKVENIGNGQMLIKESNQRYELSPGEFIQFSPESGIVDELRLSTYKSKALVTETRISTKQSIVSYG